MQFSFTSSVVGYIAKLSQYHHKAFDLNQLLLQLSQLLYLYLLQLIPIN
ncbi:hypothetical protein PTUN_a0160 [Pseudoalteromonas tunicata]|nr:hypothetical protein PTUN_a0160 [Pseudoalteromonas tunicata]